MKKVLSLLLTAILIATMGITVAFAAPSPEAEGVVSAITVIDANDDDVEVTIEKIDGKVNEYFYEALQGLKNEKKDKTLKVIGHYDIDIKGKPEYPIECTLSVLGISKSSKVFVLLQKGKEVIAVTPTVKDGKIIFNSDEGFDKFAIVTDGKTATNVEKENDVLSPQTSDTTVLVALIALLSVLGIAVLPKKVKN